MIFKLNKDKTESLPLTVLSSWLELLKMYPVDSDHFLDSLDHFVKAFSFSSASLYFYEKKTNTFLLKKWVGQEPLRFSVSANYEFLTQLKLRDSAIHRKEFLARSSNELRQPALFYFQNLLCNMSQPVLNEGQWLAVVNVYVPDKSPLGSSVIDFLLTWYASFLRDGLHYQAVASENKKLSEVSHIKNQLLANVTHELNTPLNGILGISEALLDMPENEAAGSMKNAIKIIQKSAQDLHKTLGNILSLMQIEAKKSESRFEKTDLVPLVHEIGALFSDACQAKKITLVLPMATERHLVFVDPQQTRTVLMNLVGNAVKFTAVGRIVVGIVKSGEVFKVSVSDSGIGMDDDKLDLIFEEFYQVDGSRTRVYGGTGLGLAIVKKIVTLHGGRIWVESQKNLGSQFTFTLPQYPI